MGKIFRVLITVPAERLQERHTYVVGEKEKDFLVGVFKDNATVEELDYPESAGNKRQSD